MQVVPEERGWGCGGVPGLVWDPELLLSGAVWKPEQAMIAWCQGLDLKCHPKATCSGLVL